MNRIGREGRRPGSSIHQIPLILSKNRIGGTKGRQDLQDEQDWKGRQETRFFHPSNPVNPVQE
jgi:hypothetical protein